MHRDGRVLVAAAAAILCHQLILPPVVGLADNGDFSKVIGRFSLEGRTNLNYRFTDVTYEFHPERHFVSPYFSSEILLVRAALALNGLLSKDGNFDLRLIGMVHGALFLAALWLFAPLLDDARRALRLSMYALILLVYCDVMYVSGLNSFYMDEPAYLFLLLAAALYLRVLRWRRGRDVALLLACLLLLVTAKTQHAVLGLWIAALLSITLGKRLAMPSVCLALAAALMLWRGEPAEHVENSAYNVAFTQILPHSRNVARTLADLGLDDSYRPYIGMNAYMPGCGMGDPQFRREFGRRLSLAKLARFYLTHPRDAYEALRNSLSGAGRQREFGNFDQSAGYPPGAESRSFALWSDCKRALFFHRGPRVLFSFLGLAVAVSLLLWASRKRLPAGALAGGFTLMGMALTEMLVSSLADAMEIARHHQIFFAMFDLLLLSAIYLGLRLAAEVRHKP